ncbi:glycosyltransferase family 2 protein [Arenimonas sp.]|uniref:glycosyltransferase family 2 protein n=1 Tax=Arenimonas sp. TaxID=1872635 RepID=UPI0039E38DAF
MSVTVSRLSVVIPSRLAPMLPSDSEDRWYVERALANVRGQSAARDGLELELIVGVDAGQGERARERLGPEVLIVEAPRRSQASALNAAMAKATGEAIAFLEDDDLWSPEHLGTALQQLADCDFVSSTQLEVTPEGAVLRIFDYATPSGWVMPRATLNRVGLFDEEYRWHLDTEWLGRLGQSKLRRVHLVEATAPISWDEIVGTRVGLPDILRSGGGNVRLVRHESPWPLVRRTCHPGSGMAQIAKDPVKAAASKAEYDRMWKRFKCIPW